MLTTIVVPTVDAGDMLLRALEYVDADSPDIELVIVDNGSTDDSVERTVARFPHAHVIRNESNAGFAPACNRGAEYAHGKYILFLNNDAFLSASDLKALVDAAQGDRPGAVWQPVNYNADGAVDSAGDLFNRTGIFVHETDIPAEEVHAIFATKGPALLVRTNEFRSLGGFHDDYFAYFEESDLCWRARMQGFEVRVVTTARVAHIGGQTTARILSPEDIRYLAFRNRFRTILSNASASTLAVMVPLHLLACLGFVASYVVTRRPRSAASVVKALWWAVGNHDVWRRQRASVQADRRLADRDVLRRDLRASFTPAVLWRHARRHIFLWEKAAGTAGGDQR